MRKLPATAAFIALVCLPVFAQANDPFAGFSAELRAAHTSYEGSISNFTVNGTAVPTTTLSFDDLDKSKTVGGFALGYTIPIDKTIYLGFSYERSLQDAKLGPPTGVLNGTRVEVSDQVKVKDAQALVFQPSYKMSNNALIAFRLGYVESTMEIESAGEPTDKIKASGTLVGIGLRRAMTQSVYVSASYDVYNYNSKSVSGVDSDGDRYTYNFKPKGSAFTVSLGYRF